MVRKEKDFLATLIEIFEEEDHKNFGSISCKKVASKMKITTKEVRKLAVGSKYCPTAKGEMFSSFLVVIW